MVMTSARRPTWRVRKSTGLAIKLQPAKSAQAESAVSSKGRVSSATFAPIDRNPKAESVLPEGTRGGFVN